jgi:sugar lactone lactonase YvrE
MIKRALGVLIAAGLAYLLFWPVGIEPVAWAPPPKVDAPLNDKLKTLERVHKELKGPEAIAFDADGGLYAGLDDGRIVRVSPEDKVETVVDTGDKALGLKFSPEGKLYICAMKGLLSVGADGKLETLSAPFVFADDLDFGADGAVYFSDASQRHDVRHFIDDLLEHQTTGRLMRYDPSTKQTTVRADGFQFANGVAAGPDRTWVVVAETGNYRLTRVDLSDGKKTIFADSLPGFPDNVTWSPSRQVFWVAIGSPRDPAVDALAPYPFLRKVVARLPKAVQPKPQPHATVLAFDAAGKRVENLQWKDPVTYAPIASVIEHDGALYLGSFREDGYARYRLP